MKKFCEYCKTEFETGKSGNAKRFCSHECYCMAARKRNFEKREARAKELGITVEELAKRIKRGTVGLRNSYRSKKRPKTYAEICAYNKAHPLVDGWRR